MSGGLDETYRVFHGRRGGRKPPLAFEPCNRIPVHRGRSHIAFAAPVGLFPGSSAELGAGIAIEGIRASMRLQFHLLDRKVHTLVPTLRICEW